jgi:phage/plasmid-associated DNA primase
MRPADKPEAGAAGKSRFVSLMMNLVGFSAPFSETLSV